MHRCSRAEFIEIPAGFYRVSESLFERSSVCGGPVGRPSRHGDDATSRLFEKGSEHRTKSIPGAAGTSSATGTDATSVWPNSGVMHPESFANGITRLSIHAVIRAHPLLCQDWKYSMQKFREKRPLVFPQQAPVRASRATRAASRIRTSAARFNPGGLQGKKVTLGVRGKLNRQGLSEDGNPFITIWRPEL